MRRNDYEKWLGRIRKAEEKKQIVLPRDEYARVMSELNTHMSDEDRACKIVTKPIGDFFYTVINKGYDDYIIIGKHKIVEETYSLMEETDE